MISAQNCIYLEGSRISLEAIACLFVLIIYINARLQHEPFLFFFAVFLYTHLVKRGSRIRGSLLTASPINNAKDAGTRRLWRSTPDGST